MVLRELGRQERDVLQKMAEITKEGFLLKQQLIEEAKKGRQEKQVRFDFCSPRRQNALVSYFITDYINVLQKCLCHVCLAFFF